MIAVLDTNVLVSGLINPHGAPARILAAWRDEKFELVVSDPILQEVGEVLNREKIRRYYQSVDRDLPVKLIAGLRRFARLVPGQIKVDLVEADPADNMFLSAALEARADYLVTGDHHLLQLKAFEGTSIVRPVEFLVILETEQKD